MQSAIFFESLEEIYGRIYRSLNPRANLREVSVRFRKYANANSRIRLDRDRLAVDISDVLKEAPAPIQEALAILLVSKLLRRTPDPLSLAQYQRYVSTARVQDALQTVKRERGRKAIRHPSGEFFDLNKIFEDLKTRYFGGRLRKPTIGWSLRGSRSTLGHYDPAHDAVVLSSVLDSAECSYLIVSYVLFHELLHTIYPAESRSARRCVHTAEFKAAEKQFEDREAAIAALKKFLGSMPGNPVHGD
ncbi:MAG: M48 family peptidase [Bryobacteraceae bacterium]